MDECVDNINNSLIRYLPITDKLNWRESVPASFCAEHEYLPLSKSVILRIVSVVPSDEMLNLTKS